MNTVERVISICKERKIPISRLEKECGMSNGYIKGLKKGTIPVSSFWYRSGLDMKLTSFQKSRSIVLW